MEPLAKRCRGFIDDGRVAGHTSSSSSTRKPSSTSRLRSLPAAVRGTTYAGPSTGTIVPRSRAAKSAILADASGLRGTRIRSVRIDASVPRCSHRRTAAASEAGVPVAVGSGVTDENAASLAGSAQALIVGSWLKRDGHWRNPVDAERVRRLSAALGR